MDVLRTKQQGTPTTRGRAKKRSKGGEMRGGGKNMHRKKAVKRCWKDCKQRQKLLFGNYAVRDYKNTKQTIFTLIRKPRIRELSTFYQTVTC